MTTTRLDDPQLYINRELSWLEFNQRVLDQALNESNPLLERVKFAGIMGMLYDEFAMKRTGGLLRQARKGWSKRGPGGLTSAEVLEACRAVCPEVVIVFASTRQIYGKPQYLPVDERHPLHPVDVNGVNKMAGEAYHILYHDVYGIRATALRLGPDRRSLMPEQQGGSVVQVAALVNDGTWHYVSLSQSGADQSGPDQSGAGSGRPGTDQHRRSSGML